MVPLLASKTHTEIHMTDYVSANTDAVRSWVNKETNAHDWSPFSKVIAEQEGLRYKELIYTFLITICYTDSLT